MKYEFKSRVRYSEIGEDRKLTLDGILNYFQDCTTFHSEEVGLGMERLEEKRRVWMLSAWQICAERYPVPVSYTHLNFENRQRVCVF